MLINITYNNKERIERINAAVGKPYSVIERIRKRAFGSPKLFITAASTQIHELLVLDNKTDTANIEIRPNGIIFGFKSRLEAFGWIIPYHQLSVFKSRDEFSIHGGGLNVKIKGSDPSVVKFFKQLNDLKIKSQADSTHPNMS